MAQMNLFMLCDSTVSCAIIASLNMLRLVGQETGHPACSSPVRLSLQGIVYLQEQVSVHGVLWDFMYLFADD